eukprot:CAMPEP_0197076118 /NCGR_PEP_ID=MMETSP1384-20130603/211954_1 /TAXON_ID=29189 /ORGANISM="Ammonia sp." /LENGTH=423 /DNA_ID=CAMNT_0042514967 /DNA_START=148 /DNA_END=1420 /DNA_ORIENTATION=+
MENQPTLQANGILFSNCNDQYLSSTRNSSRNLNAFQDEASSSSTSFIADFHNFHSNSNTASTTNTDEHRAGHQHPYESVTKHSSIQACMYQPQTPAIQTQSAFSNDDTSQNEEEADRVQMSLACARLALLVTQRCTANKAQIMSQMISCHVMQVLYEAMFRYPQHAELQGEIKQALAAIQNFLAESVQSEHRHSESTAQSAPHLVDLTSPTNPNINTSSKPANSTEANANRHETAKQIAVASTRTTPKASSTRIVYVAELNVFECESAANSTNMSAICAHIARSTLSTHFAASFAARNLDADPTGLSIHAFILESVRLNAQCATPKASSTRIVYVAELNVFECAECGKQYKHECNLRSHCKIHTEQAYCCEFCPKKFGRKSNWIEHTRVHTGERPFECPVCKTRFKQKYALKKHMKQHSIIIA